MAARFCLVFLLLLAVAGLLAACAGPKEIVAPPGHPPPPPPPPPPPILTAPPTQRPYKVDGKTYYPLPSAEGHVEKGIASWYGRPFHGRRTACGEIYDMYAPTSAHKTLPMGTRLLVENLENGRETVVRVNDRGPFVRGRIIDLSYASALQLGMSEKGTAPVRISALGEAVGYAQGGVPRLAYADFDKGEFYIQLGAFVDKDNADRLQEKISAWDKKVIVRQFDRGDLIFFRVWAYAGTDLAEARRAERVWSEAGFPEAFVIAK